jgi:hypothetical protein
MLPHSTCDIYLKQAVVSKAARVHVIQGGFKQKNSLYSWAEERAWEFYKEVLKDC